MTTLTGSDSALLQLADVGPELHIARVHGFHHRVGLVAGLDARAGVLMQSGDDADPVERLADFVERRDDVRFVVGEDELLTLDVVRTDNRHRCRRIS